MVFLELDIRFHFQLGTAFDGRLGEVTVKPYLLNWHSYDVFDEIALQLRHQKADRRTAWSRSLTRGSTGAASIQVLSFISIEYSNNSELFGQFGLFLVVIVR